MERSFGYGLEELARRFDRSVSWVSRRFGLALRRSLGWGERLRVDIQCHLA
jgi:hypothetical protein